MEFLDDLREQRKTDQQSSQQVPSGYESSASDANPWETLLEEVGSSESQATAPLEMPKRRKSARRMKPAKSRREGARRGLSAGQVLTLGVLAMLVVGAWIAIGAVLTGSVSVGGAFGAAASPAPVTADVGMAPLAEPVALAATTAPSQASDQGQAPAGVEPIRPPISLPRVSTVYDSQILQDPSNVDLYLKRGATYLSLRVYDAAFADYQQAIALNELNPEAYIGLGRAHYYTFAWDEAEVAFANAIALDKNAAGAYFARGLLRYYQGAYAEAARDFDAAAEINPRDAEAEAWLAISAARSGDTLEAADAVHRAMLQDQKLPLLYIARSWSQRGQNPPNLEGAHGDLLYAFGLAPNQFLTLNALAEFYAEHRPERLSEAEVRAIHAGEWATNDVERALSLHTLGRVYLALDRKMDAMRVLSQAVDLATVDGKTYLVGLEEDLLRAR
jgi:tetratricopeptide (TPR) repeat protein